ncbi:diacylglycerol kinase-like protein [Panacagrimonas perspica]|uniref:Diacylglycerol kinase-like protein n=1 Tax=Panacagrimonas perspica TaxID=381431 RepID=A0A4R7P761_9GAMM|nr:diacylglycerol kinase family protein [Panacagrimonas perspica]TDU28920.1 diacylglycerol kinase-like protein [Panacagrimonas perspica]THD02257.1 hypothetical protein B1810_15115 [Panacagrimonas perspica]
MNAPLAAPLAPPEAELPACLIVNPKSFRASRGGLAARAVALAKSYGADVLEIDAGFGLLKALDERLARGIRRIFVLAGDGTMHAIVEHLARLPAGSLVPELMLLGGGRTNLTAAEFDGNGDLLKKLESALARHRDGRAFEIEGRRLLVLEQEPAPARHGFFIAAGLVDEAIRECHDYQQGDGSSFRKGPFATPIHLAKMALLGLIGRGPLKSPQMSIDAGERGSLAGPMRIVLLTTLEHRKGLFDPYAKRGQGTLRLTAITAGALAFWTCLALVATGRFFEFMNIRRGYLSGRCDRVEVMGLRHYALDGEEFEADPSRPVIISSGLQLSFLRP